MNRIIVYLLIAITTISCDTYDLVNGYVVNVYENYDFYRKDLHISNGVINYWDSDSTSNKPVLVLIHGFGNAARFQWQRQIKVLREEFRVVIPNLYYFGNSISDEKKYSIDFQVKAIKEFADSLKLGKYNLCGQSYGGLVSAELALVDDRVSNLILMSSPVKFYTLNDVKKVTEKYKVDSIQNLFLPDSYRELNKLMQIAFYKRKRIPSVFYKSFYENLYKGKMEDKAKLMKYMVDNAEYLQSREYKYNFQVMIIWGEHDPLIPARVGRELKEYFGGKTKMILIPEAAHVPCLERPKDVNKAILSFLVK